MLDDVLEFYNLILKTQSFCEENIDKSFNKEILCVNSKILFLIYKEGQVSPSVLVNELKMAKSNVALFCKNLLKEQFIKSIQDSFDHRIIYYCLTSKGQEYVENMLKDLQNKMSNSFEKSSLEKINQQVKQLNKLFDKSGEKKW